MEEFEIENIEKQVNFIFSGKAVFTISSNKSGKRFTYKVKANKEDDNKFFIYLLTGPDNTSDYSYLGMINKKHLNVYPTQATRISVNSPSFKAIDWMLKSFKEQKNSSFKIHHMGRCGRCSRPLTDPDSIERGLGPTCFEIS